MLDIPALRFVDGSTTAVFGPNGSGKTTLLRLIGGLERPTAGGVRIGEAPVNGDPASRRQVAFAFQEAVFVRGSVRDNLDLALRLAGRAPGGADLAPRPRRRASAASSCCSTGPPGSCRPARRSGPTSPARCHCARR